MKAYRLPGIESSGRTDREVIVGMEMKSEYMHIINGSREIADDLLLYRGVSEKDIIESPTVL